MNKKKYLSMGVFVVVVVIGAGVAYYFDPTAINNVIGINTAQTDAGVDVDMATLDDASSTMALASDAGDGVAMVSNEDAASAPLSTKKAKSKKVSASKSVAKDVSKNTSSVDPAMDIVLNDGADAVSSDTLLPDDNATTAESSTLALASMPAQASTPATNCSFPGAAPTPTRKVVFNEIAWMGSSSSSNAEWMELKNRTTGTVDLSGWELLNASGKIKVTFGAGDTLAPGALFLLSRSAVGGGVNTTFAVKMYSGDLANSGDTLVLMDAQCEVSDYLDASHGWPGGNNTTKQTLERNADSFGWHTSVSPGGTPGAQNSVVPVSVSAPQSQTQQTVSASVQYAAPTTDEASAVATTTATITDAASSGDASVATTTADAAASTTTAPTIDVSSAVTHALISAVQIAGASSSNDLVKIYNPTASTIDVSGWRLRKKSQTGTDYSLKEFPAGSAIAAGQTFVWANSLGGFSEMAGANVSSTETLAADNSVALFDAAGTIVDAVAWGTGSGQYGEGPPFSTNPGAGQTLARRSANGVMVDTDSNINDFIIQ